MQDVAPRYLPFLFRAHAGFRLGHSPLQEPAQVFDFLEFFRVVEDGCSPALEVLDVPVARVVERVVGFAQAGLEAVVEVGMFHDVHELAHLAVDGVAAAVVGDIDERPGPVQASPPPGVFVADPDIELAGPQRENDVFEPSHGSPFAARTSTGRSHCLELPGDTSLEGMSPGRCCMLTASA